MRSMNSRLYSIECGYSGGLCRVVKWPNEHGSDGRVVADCTSKESAEAALRLMTTPEHPLIDIIWSSIQNAPMRDRPISDEQRRERELALADVILKNSVDGREVQQAIQEKIADADVLWNDIKRAVYGEGFDGWQCLERTSVAEKRSLSGECDGWTINVRMTRTILK